jgi:hypothetical protein
MTPRKILDSMDYMLAYMGIHQYRGSRLRTSNMILGVRSNWADDKFMKGFYDCWITVEVWQYYGDISITCLGLEAFPSDPEEVLMCLKDAIDPSIREVYLTSDENDDVL